MRSPPMRSPRWKKALGDLGQHRGRTLLVVFAIAVGLAGAGTILNAWALVGVATREGFLASDPPAATVFVDSVDAALLARARTVPGVRLAEARRTTTVRAQVGGAMLTAVLFSSDGFDAARIGRVKPESDEWPPKDGTLVVERSSLDFSGASVGEAVVLSYGGAEPVSVPVSGIARDVTLAPGWMEHVLYGFVTPATLLRLGAPGALNELRIVTGDRTLSQDDVRVIAYRVRAAAESLGHRVRDVDVPVPGVHIHAAQMDSLLYTQGAFALMALVLSAFLVVNLIAAMLAGQTREIGVMKAIGARWQQIAAMYLAVAALLGVAAVVVAVPLALFAGRQYAAIKADLLNFDVSGYSVPVWVIVLQVSVGVLLPVLAAAAPVWRACRMSVAEALRDVGIAGGGGSEWLTHRVRGMSRPMLLSLRNVFRRRQRLVLTLLALSTGGAVFLGALNLRASVLGVTDALFAAQRFDFSLRMAVPQHADTLESIVRAVSGVDAAEAWAGARAATDRDDGTLGNSFPITAVRPSTAMLIVKPVEGRWLGGADARELVVNRPMLRVEPTWVVGTRTRLVINGQREEWTIVGVVDAGTGPIAYAPRASVANSGGGATSVVVRSAGRDAAAQLDLIQRLRSALLDRGIAVSSSNRVEEARGAVEDHLLMVVDFLGGMAWLMILVGGLGLASTMGMAVLERTREIGVLRAIGAKHRAIFALVQVEGLVIALLSWVVAIPMSVPISVLLGKAFGRIMLPVPVTYLPNGVGVVTWLGLVVIVALLACAWPAVRALRVPTAAALSYE